MSLTPRYDNLGEILRRFHRDVSCAINTLLAHERYDAPRNIFDGRVAHCMRLLDAAAQAGHLTYEYLNPVAAGLVARPEDMPGTTVDFGHWKSDGIVVRRPDVYFSDDRPEELRLELTPPPLLMHAFGGDLDALVYHMRRLCEDGARALRDARKGRPPLGAQKLKRMHPWNEPKTLAEPGGRLVPSFKIGARGLAGQQLACDAAYEVRAFHEEHEIARRQRRAGMDATFPHGTYAMRVLHNVRVAEPLPDAIVARPGPLLDEVLELLREGKSEEHAIPMRAAVLEEVRAAWTDDAAQVLELEQLDFAEASAPSTAVSAAPSKSKPSDAPESRGRPEPRVRHRFDRDLDRGGEHPRRLITKRDRRRGRRRRTDGADPPA